MKSLICALTLGLFIGAPLLVQAGDSTEARPRQELEQYDAKTKRACMKKCIDAQDKCNKGCKKGNVVDRKCKHNCGQTRDACLKAC